MFGLFANRVSSSFCSSSSHLSLFNLTFPDSLLSFPGLVSRLLYIFGGNARASVMEIPNKHHTQCDDVIHADSHVRWLDLNGPAIHEGWTGRWLAGGMRGCGSVGCGIIGIPCWRASGKRIGEIISQVGWGEAFAEKCVWRIRCSDDASLRW